MLLFAVLVAATTSGLPPADRNFAALAASQPLLLPHLLPRPRGGFHEWTFALYGAPTSIYGDAFANLTRAMKAFGVGNGFDPLGVDRADFKAASKLGWPISFSPIQGGNVCFQVPSCPNNMTVQQHSRLQILQDANVYSEVCRCFGCCCGCCCCCCPCLISLPPAPQIQFGEWGYWFAGLRPAKGGGNVAWWHAVFKNTTCDGAKCATAPSNPSNKCCALCMHNSSCGNASVPGSLPLINTTGECCCSC